jgi:carboxylesterase type B
MVWLHGGGFAIEIGSGPSAAPRRVGPGPARRVAVVATVNHGLGAFGGLYAEGAAASASPLPATGGV